MDLSGLPVTYEATVLAEYIDGMGHMNVMWYTHLFDQATWAFFAMAGMDADYFRANRTGAAALEQHTRYLAELRLGAKVVIRSRALDRTAKRFHFMHFMTNGDSGELSATTELIGTHVDLSVRRSTPLPDFVKAAFDRMLTEQGPLGWDAPICGAMRP